MIEATTKKRRWLGWVITLVVIVAVEAVLHSPWPRGTIRISPQTTVVDGPLNEDGTVNYVAALDAAWAKGVTRENNAVIPLLEIFGPQVLPEAVRGPVLAKLGVTLDPHKAYYIAWEDWFAIRQPASDKAQTQPAEDDTTDKTWELFDNSMDRLRAGQDAPELRQWVKANGAFLDLIVAATRRPRYYVPMVSTASPPQVIEVTGPNLRMYREAGRALMARVELEIRGGQTKAAWQDVLAIHRLARLIGQGLTLLEKMIGMALEDDAVQAGARVADSGRCTAAEARSMLADLAQFPPVDGVLDSIDRAERFMWLDSIMVFYRGGFFGKARVASPRTGALDWDEMLLVGNRFYDRIVAAGRIADFTRREQALQAISQSAEDAVMGTRGVAAMALKYLLPVIGGRAAKTVVSHRLASVLTYLLTPSLAKVFEFQDAAQLRMELEKVSLALAAYRAEHGRWPDKLTELAPAYLPEIPADRLSGSPLVYRPSGKGYRLYSVGVNKRDDGGVYRHSESPSENKDDISVEAK